MPAISLSGSLCRRLLHADVQTERYVYIRGIYERMPRDLPTKICLGEEQHCPPLLEDNAVEVVS